MMDDDDIKKWIEVLLHQRTDTHYRVKSEKPFLVKITSEGGENQSAFPLWDRRSVANLLTS